MNRDDLNVAKVVEQAQQGRLSRRGLAKASLAAGAALSLPGGIASASGAGRISFPSASRQDETPKTGGVLL